MSLADDDIRAAAHAGVITPAQAEQLAAFVATRRAAGSGAATFATTAPPPSETLVVEPPDADTEKFRILGGFNDVFAAIGVALLYGALMVAAGTVAPILLSGVGAVAAWGLSEVFTRRMRLALPSILLALLFSASCAITAVILLAMWEVDPIVAPGQERGWSGASRWFANSYGAALGVFTTLAAFTHHRRFGVPIDWAIGAGGLILAALALLGGPFGVRIGSLFFFASGLATFALALSLDLSDPLRRTTRSDSAFWLHLLAAPLMIHPLVGGLAGSLTALTFERALMVLAAFAAIAVVSLTIDRRALLVSGLSYTGAALAFLVRGAGVASGTGVVIVTLLLLAVVVLSLSAGWTWIRGLVVPLLPLGALAARLPPTRRAA